MQNYRLQLNENVSNITDVLKQLVDFGYTRVPMVIVRGQCSLRGDILDIFGQNHSHPVRVEFFGNQIDDIRTFDITTQRSINKIESVSIASVEEESRVFSQIVDSGGVSLDAAYSLHDGEYVVHENHGIGVYRGLRHLATSALEGEYLLVEYKNKDQLYVPLEQINMIHKYEYSEVHPQVNSLSDGSWNKTTKKAKKAAENIAHELLTLYKIRSNRKGHSFSGDSVWQIDLEKSFEYQETKDQLKAIDAVKQDMESDKPMDRLICGDVGFGKTEVALRAAFKATVDDKQVAILVPTTVLSEQYFRQFQERFEPFGHNIEVINRFKTAKQQKEILQKLSEGKIDLVIGTHRLLQKDVAFKDLGLLIIDEEHRFGVKHKEVLKHYRKVVDVLTMTATPIPRTLYMSLAGIRDLSIIATPPRDRQPVQTKVSIYDEKLIKKSIMRELKRGGQVFWLQNDIRVLEGVADRLQHIIPGIRVGVGHGQMKGHELEKVMLDFLDHKYDVLACSTIIESGLDIPNANTIIVVDADHFGLAQLHQLRGRVGRSNVAAYAYMFYRSGKNLRPNALKRLEAIEKFSSLGAGIDISMRDLQIRGAGDILGSQQSGNMISVGFEVYTKMLDNAIATFRGEPQHKPKNLVFDKLFIPSDYIEDEPQRISIYKRLLIAENKDDLISIEIEMRDRFGTLPREVKELLEHCAKQLS